MAGPLNDIRVEEQDLSSADLTLEADTSESLEILARGVTSGADETVITETIDETMMLAAQADDGDDDVFPEQVLHNQHTDLLWELARMGYDLPTLKVPEGKEYVLSDPDGNANGTVYYREAAAGQFNDRSDGAPSGTVRPFITSGQSTESVASQATENFAVDTSVNPAQLDDFPYEEDVRADREYDLVGLMTSLDGSSGGNVTYDGFRLTSEEKDFIARSSAFIDPSNAQYPSDELDTMPWVFPEPITFTPGDDLEFRAQASNANTMTAEDAIVNVGMVFVRRNVGGR